VLAGYHPTIEPPDNSYESIMSLLRDSCVMLDSYNRRLQIDGACNMPKFKDGNEEHALNTTRHRLLVRWKSNQASDLKSEDADRRYITYSVLSKTREWLVSGFLLALFEATVLRSYQALLFCTSDRFTIIMRDSSCLSIGRRGIATSDKTNQHTTKTNDFVDAAWSRS
jgi:hypothetical protein